LCVVVEEGVAAEDPMLFAEVTVEPEVGLILIVGFVAARTQLLAPVTLGSG